MSTILSSRWIIAQIALFLFCCTSPECALAQDTPAASASAGFRYTVSLELPGASSENKALLEGNLDLLRWQGNPHVDEEQFLRLYRAAPEQIKTLLASEGYFQASVRPSLARDTSPWQARFQIQLGEPVLVEKIDLRVQDLGAGPEGGGTHDASELLAGWNLPVGSVFRQSQWEAAKRSILRQLSLVRYPRAQLMESRAEVDVQSRQVTLHLLLDTGPEVRFGSLKIEGLQRYPQAVVDNLNTIKTGELYTEKALLDLQQALQDSKYFANVVVSAEFTPEMDMFAKASVPVLVRLTEFKRKKVDAGIGYSTNTGNRVQLVLEDLSFWGMQLKSEFMLETRKQNVALDFALPTTVEGYHDSFGTSLTRSNLEGETTVQARVGYRRRWGGPQLSRDFSAELIHERKTIGDLPTVDSSSLPLNYEVTWRKLDNLLQPRKGYLLQAKLSAAPLTLFGAERFVRLYGRSMHYWPLGKQGIMITRAELGALASRNTERIPSTYLFRAGGDQSVRGYAYQELGVHEGDAITGGRFMLSASFEYQHWLKPEYGAAIFVDGGNAANQVHQLRPALGYGLGVRWNSPVGPINLDLARGRDAHKNRLHFSLGLAF